ncbi:MAG: NCS1 family nucleobase:cation symporter-1 [Elusimicrobia bacterium]|nr:NCS1 family nucleobase:cation symporter-1 [Elusimicrobiota bacterium]
MDTLKNAALLNGQANIPLAGIRVTGGIHELEADLSRSPHWNHDLAPTKLKNRKWGMWDIAALWIGMSVCTTTYMLASSLIAQGMSWWQAILTIALGNVVVLIPMILNAHAGTKYGISFPVYCRASFGVLGSNIPAVLRALVACGWFGIQTWIGGWAIFKLMTVFYPSWDALPAHYFGINAAQLGCFLGFWALNMAIVWKGMESIRHVEGLSAPLLLVMGAALLIWAYVKAGGFGPMLSQPSQFVAGGPREGQFWSFFFPALTGMVGYWATLSLNIPDFTRYAKSQKDQMAGQALGLPTTMTLYSFVGVAVTSATIVIFGEAIWDPVVLLSKFSNPAIIIVSMLALTLATLTTNLAANVVSPANDFANLWPKKISFKIGGLITGVIGILMMPWKLVADPTGYIFTWLIGYSALLGSIGGVLLCDYFLIRRAKLELAELFRHPGAYSYLSGINYRAVAALVSGVLPCLPGFLGTIGAADVSGFWMHMYHYAWFVSFAVSFGVYATLMGSPNAVRVSAAAKSKT